MKKKRISINQKKIIIKIQKEELTTLIAMKKKIIMEILKTKKKMK